jgi:hypothetical protein
MRYIRTYNNKRRFQQHLLAADHPATRCGDGNLDLVPQGALGADGPELAEPRARPRQTTQSHRRLAACGFLPVRSHAVA